MSTLLRYLNDEDGTRLLASARRLVFDRGHVILAEGSANQALFFVRSGRLAVEREHMAQRVRIAHMYPGEQFGEMSLIDQSAASATVVADERSEIDVVDGSEINRLIECVPGFEGRFYRSLALALSDRLRERTAQFTASYSWG